jgi:PAS domain S-box-containing protein
MRAGSPSPGNQDMDKIHDLLRQQIKTHLGKQPSFPPEFRRFLNAVSAAYVRFDAGTALLKRALDLSSQELVEANEEMRALIQSFPDLLFRIDSTGKILDYKVGSEKVLYALSENIIGKRIQGIPVKDVSMKFRSAIGKVLTTKKIVGIEYSLSKGSHEYYYEARLSPLPDDQIMVIIRDITDRKRAETALKAGEEKYRSLIENINIGVYRSTRLRFLQANPAMVKIFGHSSLKEFLTVPVASLYENPDRRRSFTEKIRRQGFVKNEILKLRRKDGSSIWGSVTARVQYDDNRAIRWIDGVIEDISERKSAEEKIKQSEERFRSLVQNSSDIITLLDKKGRIDYASASVERILGYSPGELIGSNAFEYVHQDDLKRVSEAFARVIHSPSLKSTTEFRYKHKDNTWRMLEATSSNQTANPAISHIVVNSRDITKRKHTEEEREKLRTQLLQSQKMEAIGQFAGGIAHDFNNILTVIMGCAHYLKKELKDDDPLQVDINDMLASTEKASNLVQSLLTLSRKKVINPQHIDLNEIVQNMQRLLIRIISEDIKVGTGLADRKLIVMADPGQIEMVLMNLVMNARDAMPAGGRLTISTGSVEIDDEHIEAGCCSRRGKYATIVISDTGRGMDEHTRERIFDPFFTTKEAGKGTGLGLAMVHGIVKQHNGYINVYSEIGMGTTFRIYLPVASKEAACVKPQCVRTPEKGTETLLFAEDNKEVRKFIKMMLEKYGYEVIEAKDGEDAVSKFLKNKNRIQMLLFDVIMPKKNGKEAYDLIRRIRPDIKALFVSGYAADAIRKRGLLEEGCDFVQKPVSPLAFLKKIREVIEK